MTYSGLYSGLVASGLADAQPEELHDLRLVGWHDVVRGHIHELPHQGRLQAQHHL
jgi:hypothetical protein